MAKFSFWKEYWLVNDSDWVKQRENEWFTIERMFAATHNKNELASMKTYFMKGTWTPDAKYEPTSALKFLFCPNPSLEVYEIILSEITDINKLQYFREELIYKLCSNPWYSILLSNSGMTKPLLKHITLEQEKYTNNTCIINNHEVRVFPCELGGGVKTNFFSFYISKLLDWFETKQANPESGVIYLLTHWFTALPFLELNSRFHQADLDRLYTLFLNIQNFIPVYHLNSGAKEKNLFVTRFIECVEEYGFHHEAIRNLWNKAKVDKEDAWVDECHEYSKDDIDDWENFDGEIYRTLVYRGTQIPSDLDKKIATIYSEFGFINTNLEKINCDYIDITEQLSVAFKNEFSIIDNDKIQGRRLRLLLTCSFTGTERVNISLDLITFSHLVDSEIDLPRFMIVERADKPYNLCNSRVYSKNRQFIVDAVKDKLGIQLLRYYGYSHDPATNLKIPPDTEDFEIYLKAMESPFYDVSYFPLVVGTTPFLDKPELDYKIL